MKGWRRALGVGLAIATIALLAWLRDPAWLADVETGFRPWTVDGEGTRGRWIGGHASFFVPADAVTVTIPLRAAGSPGDPATTVSITIDDRPADRIVLNDGRWRESRLRMPPPGSRHLRRIDIRADRVQEGNRGVMVGEVHVSGLGSQGFSRLSGFLRVRGSYGSQGSGSGVLGFSRASPEVGLSGSRSARGPRPARTGQKLCV